MNTKLIIAGCIGIILLTWLIPAPEQKVVFFDVGQGDSILLQDKSMQVLVDGGPQMAVLERLGEELPWFDRTIDVIVLTHPQADHMAGLLHVLQRYQVGLVIFPRVYSPTAMEEKWLDLVTAQNVPWRFAWAGQQISAGDIKLNFLNPLTDNNNAAKLDINNDSAIVRADYWDLSFLFTGDAERPVENKLIARYVVNPPDKGEEGGFANLLNIDVLKLGHHGSKTSTSAAFLTATSPQAAVVSVGADNKYGHPNQEVLDRLKGLPLWRTDQNGSVKFIFLNNRWHIKTSR